MEPLRIRRVPARPLARGFTLIELMVVLAIIVAITTVVLTNQNTFNKTLILANTAYDIALTLRSAQTYGLSSRSFNVSTNAGYGLHFQSTPAGSFTLFADMYPAPNISNCHGLPAGGASAPDAKPGNCMYDGSNEKVMDYTLGNGIIVNNFCAYSGASGSCEIASGPYSGGLSSLDIVFARPNPDAFIRANGSSYTGACLSITSPQGGAKYVSVAASGQIIANAAACPPVP